MNNKQMGSKKKAPSPRLVSRWHGETIARKFFIKLKDGFLGSDGESVQYSIYAKQFETKKDAERMASTFSARYQVWRVDMCILQSYFIVSDVPAKKS